MAKDLDRMTRQEYINARALHDFDRYVAHRQPHYSTPDAVTRLFDAVKPRLDPDRCTQAIDSLLDQTLGLERFKKPDGTFVTQLPDWVDASLPQAIAARFADGLSLAIDPAPLLGQIERLTWAQGIPGMTDALSGFVAEAQKRADGYDRMPLPTTDPAALDATLAAARTVTLGERLTGTNDNDILQLRSALRDAARSQCMGVLYHALAAAYRALASLPGLTGIIDRYRSYDGKQSAAEAPTAPEPEWEQEYNHAMPLQFFSHNLDDIAPDTAFRMILISAMARHEPYLRSAGCLNDHGELLIFTGNTPWYALDFACLLS